MHWLLYTCYPFKKIQEPKRCVTDQQNSYWRIKGESLDLLNQWNGEAVENNDPTMEVSRYKIS